MTRKSAAAATLSRERDRSARRAVGTVCIAVALLIGASVGMTLMGRMRVWELCITVSAALISLFLVGHFALIFHKKNRSGYIFGRLCSRRIGKLLPKSINSHNRPREG